MIGSINSTCSTASCYSQLQKTAHQDNAEQAVASQDASKVTEEKNTNGTNTNQNNQSSTGHEKTIENPVEKSAKQAFSDKVKEKSADGQRLSEKELEEVEKLKDRDREVRTHEAAHAAAAGPYAQGGPSFSFEQGPDGKRYAVGGEVQIDTSTIAGDPQATLQKANRIRAAALAPAEPSAQDRQVAAEAIKMATDARAQIAEQQHADIKENDSTTESSKTESDATDNQQHAESRASKTYKNIASINDQSGSKLQLDLVI